MECLLATNWRNIVAGCKFLVASLYNVNDAIHSMVISIRFDCLRTKVSINSLGVIVVVIVIVVLPLKSFTSKTACMFYCTR